MRFQRESKRDAYDVIVVGSGIGGLTAAALLARTGRSVLVVERHDRTGGYAHSFRRSPYLFDSAVHMVGGCAEPPSGKGGLIHRVLSALAVDNQCAFEAVDPCYTAVFPDYEMRVPCGLDAFIQAHVAAFPQQADGIRRIVQECVSIRHEIDRATEYSIRSPAEVPTLSKYRRTTLGAVMDDMIDDPHLKAVFAALWPYLGLPPSRVSFLYWATMLMSYIADGTFYCRGTFQKLADALAHALETADGEMLLRTTVRRVRVEAGRATGIVLENGQRIDAPVVVSNADALQTVEELVGVEEFPTRYVRSLRRMQPSVSACVIYTAIDRALPWANPSHETFVYENWDHDETYRTTTAGDPTWVSITAPTLSDPSLAPSDQHLLIMTTLVGYDTGRSWREDKGRYVEQIVSLAARHLPDLRAHIRFSEGSTPRTMERYTRNTGGALYGWELSPGHVGAVRLGPATPIQGLYLAGHWTQPGGGIYAVVTSGVQTARIVLKCATEAALWDAVAGGTAGAGSVVRSDKTR